MNSDLANNPINANNPTKRIRHQCQNLNDILNHMSDGNVEIKSKILANVKDAGGDDVGTSVAKNQEQ